ncbi:unnamed protein product [Closterium sp. Naga37s-1]|nr:unnamed protein product [Closterium sp. Naga37s-1]
MIWPLDFTKVQQSIAPLSFYVRSLSFSFPSSPFYIPFPLSFNTLLTSQHLLSALCQGVVVVTPQDGSHDDGAPAMPTQSREAAARDEEAPSLPSQCDAASTAGEEDLVLSQHEHENQHPTSDQPDEEEYQLNAAASRSTRHSMTSRISTTTIGSTLFRTTSTNGSTSSIGSFDDDGMMEEEDAKPSSGALEAASGASGDTYAKGVGDATHENGDGSDKKPGLLAACRRIADGMLPAFLRKTRTSPEEPAATASATTATTAFAVDSAAVLSLERAESKKEAGDDEDDGSKDGAAADESALKTEVIVEDPPKLRRGSYWDLFVTFFFLGWTSFGGAAAHIAMYHKQFVELRGWMSEDMFAELLALTQTVPGPSSTQMSLAIGIMQKGITGGFLSWILFQLPGALIMSVAGFGVAKLPGALIMSVAGFGVAKFLVDPPAWLSAISAGATAVAVALIADAAVMLGSKMCLNRVTRVLCVTSAAITFYYTTQWIFPTVILLGGAVTYFTERNKPIPPQRSNIQKLGVSPLGGGMLLFAWIAVLIFAIIYNKATGSQWMHLFEGFYMTGSVTYGGGPVMLPLLESIVIEHDTVCPAGGGKCFEVDANTTMITTQQFLAGLALSQAIPGPLFNFSAYLGSVIGGIRGLATCWIAIFSPGVLIIIGILPFWGQFRKWKLYKRATPGFNATGIGLIWASAFSLGLKAVKVSPFPMASLCIGMFGYASTSFLKISPPLAIVGGAAVGVIAWATHMM